MIVQSQSSSVAVAPKNEITSANLNFLQRHVHQTTGIVLDPGKEYLLQARIAPLLSEMRLQSVDQLCDTLRRDPTGRVSRRMIDAITTNETLFFRDFATFEALRNEIGPKLLTQVQGRKLRIWSAAASSGQEAYSLAILLLEMGVKPEQVTILGTDISEEILEKARTGKYVQFEVNRGLPSALLLKYFDRVGLDWQIKPHVRQMVTFKQADLRRITSANEKFDLLLCRNVLIYFDQETKKQILSNLHGSLADHGALVLGCAETIMNADVSLHRYISGGATFYTRKCNPAKEEL